MEKLWRKCAPETSSRPLFNSGIQLEIQQMHSRSSFGNKTFLDTIIENPQKFQLHVCFQTQYLFMKIIIKNKRGLELVTCPFSSCQTYSEVCHHLAISDTLIQSGFSIIPKNSINNLCKPFHDIIIIPISTSSLNLGMDMKE